MMKNTLIKYTLLAFTLMALAGCATDNVKDEDYIKAMERQDEESFQRHMQGL
jgi:heme O synthase-like polyprenyltransferase